MEGPGDFAAGRFEGDHQGSQPDEPGEDADRESEAIAENAGPAVPGMLDKAENFERDHREDARHEIENETSNEAKEEELQQAIGRLRLSGDFRRTRGRCRNVPACRKGVIAGNNQSIKGLHALGCRLERDDEDDRTIRGLFAARMTDQGRGIG